MEVKIGMIAAVSEALSFKKQNPSARYDDIIQHITDISMVERDAMKKMGMIAAASKAIEYLERNPSANEKEIIRHVMNESGDMVKRIDLESK